MEVIKSLASPPKAAPGEKDVPQTTMSKEQATNNWEALQQFFLRPWFERAWIRQEVSLKPEARISWGDSSISIKELEVATIAAEYVDRLGHYPQTARAEQQLNFGSFFQAEAINSLRNDTASGEKFAPLSRLLLQARGFKATDSRDKVYSVLGLADPTIYKLTAEYGKQVPEAEVYVKAAKAILSRNSGIEILMACQNPQRSGGIPSWAPNLSVAWKYPPFADGLGTLTVLRNKTPQKISFDGDTLIITGDYMDAVGVLCDATLDPAATPADVDRVFLAWETFMADKNSKFEKFAGIGWRNATPDLILPGHKNTPTDGRPVPAGSQFSLLDLKHVKAQLLPAGFELPEDESRSMRANMKKYATNRRIGYTIKDMKPGIFPGDVEPGDKVVIFHGHNCPFVVRQVSGSDTDHVLVGDAHFMITAFGPTTKKMEANVTFRIM